MSNSVFNGSEISSEEHEFDLENMNKDVMTILAHSYDNEAEKENWDPYRKHHTRALSTFAFSACDKKVNRFSRRSRSTFGINLHHTQSKLTKGRAYATETASVQIARSKSNENNPQSNPSIHKELAMECHRRRNRSKTPFKEVLIPNENDSSHQKEKMSHLSPVNVTQLDNFLSGHRKANENRVSESGSVLHRRVQSLPFNQPSTSMAARKIR